MSWPPTSSQGNAGPIRTSTDLECRALLQGNPSSKGSINSFWLFMFFKSMLHENKLFGNKATFFSSSINLCYYFHILFKIILILPLKQYRNA